MIELILEEIEMRLKLMTTGWLWDGTWEDHIWCCSGELWMERNK